ncbi:MAG: hypothetical protein AAF222_04260 [Pseudomonadota bacterium]
MNPALHLRRYTAGLVASLAISLGGGHGTWAQERLTPEDFLNFALGKTLTFDTFPDGRLVGVEEFLRRDLSVWRDRSGVCVYGRITIPDGQICFLYENDDDDTPVCWVPFLKGDRWFVLNTNGSRREIQEITSVTKDGLDCPANPGV